MYCVTSLSYTMNAKKNKKLKVGCLHLKCLTTQILAANPLLVTERNLFVYFFTDPPRLAEAMAELRKKVDALALAASAGH